MTLLHKTKPYAIQSSLQLTFSKINCEKPLKNVLKSSKIAYRPNELFNKSHDLVLFEYEVRSSKAGTMSASDEACNLQRYFQARVHNDIQRLEKLTSKKSAKNLPITVIASAKSSATSSYNSWALCPEPKKYSHDNPHNSLQFSHHFCRIHTPFSSAARTSTQSSTAQLNLQIGRHKSGKLTWIFYKLWEN